MPPARNPSSEELQEWLRIPERIEAGIGGLAESALDLRGGPEPMSARETVHHLVEANLVASNMILAALATDGGDYDWSWLYPSAAWMQRLGYDRAPIGPGLTALRALGPHLAAILNTAEGALERRIRPLDKPGAKRYVKTVREILADEVAHAQHHLEELAETRARHGV